MILLTLLIQACSDTPSERYWTLRKECGLDEGDYPPMPFGETESYTSITSECSRALGAVVGLRWDTFGSSPAYMDMPRGISGQFIGGLDLFVGANLGGVAAFESDLRAGSTEEALWHNWKYSGAAPDDLPIGAFWLDVVDSAIEEVHSSSLDGAQMALVDDDELVVDSDVGAEAIPGSLSWSAGIVHEASHSLVRGHVLCPSGEYGCDSNEFGPWGLEVFFVNEWLIMNEELVNDEDCRNAIWLVLLACSRINNISDPTFCELPTTGC